MQSYTATTIIFMYPKIAFCFKLNPLTLFNLYNVYHFYKISYLCDILFISKRFSEITVF